MECSGSEDYYFDDAKFFDLSSDFISKNNDDEIEEVYLCHLIRSIDRPDKLYPLHEVLTTQNSLLNTYIFEWNVVELLSEWIIYNLSQMLNRFNTDSYEVPWASTPI